MIDRQKVLEKYDNRCAYCGTMLTLKSMQVDHLRPKRLNGSSDFDNLMPACRICNHYKRAEPLESYRTWIKTIHERILKIYIVRVAIAYGILNIKPFNGKFYFERI